MKLQISVCSQTKVLICFSCGNLTRLPINQNILNFVRDIGSQTFELICWDTLYICFSMECELNLFLLLSTLKLWVKFLWLSTLKVKFFWMSTHVIIIVFYHVYWGHTLLIFVLQGTLRSTKQMLAPQELPANASFLRLCTGSQFVPKK